MRQRQQYRQLYCVLHNFHNHHLHLPKPVGEREMKRGAGREERTEKDVGGRDKGCGQMVLYSLLT